MTDTSLTHLSKGAAEESATCSVPMDLSGYLRQIASTDRLDQTMLRPVLMGLFGEVGSILATLKKHVREQASYSGYDDAVVEEFGDALWYFAALCRRLGIEMESVVDDAFDQDALKTSVATHSGGENAAFPNLPQNHDSRLPVAFLELGMATATLLGIRDPDKPPCDLLREFWYRYMDALQAAKIDLGTVATRNICKVRGRFLDPDPSSLPTFDEAFPPDERLPERFEITILERPSGQTYLQWNDVFIGDPLTDNIAHRDDYRYHDVFHLAHAAILHWSPTFRSLIKRKRKTVPKVDESQDGGRAIVVEEGLTAWVFSRAKQLGFLERHESLSFDLLKTVQQFISGYEVEKCPLNLWEKAILRGYDVFRQVRTNGGGVIVGDRGTRTIEYRPLPDGGT